MKNLIIESGASKSDWLFYNRDNELLLQSKGYNPCTDPGVSKLTAPIEEVPFEEVEIVHYYGTGVNSSEIRDQITTTIKHICPSVKTISIENDMMACGRAVSPGEISVISILGTGCNAALFDGSKIVKTVPSLGYLFNESGSGYSIGQEVIRSFFYGYMPETVRDNFIAYHGSDIGDILKKIYQSKKPNYTIAKFAELLPDTEPEYKDYILEKIFSSFIEEKVKPIQRDNNFKLNFVGSIAYYYQDVLTMVCRMHGYEVNRIVKNPVLELKRYHLQHE